MSELNTVRRLDQLHDMKGEKVNTYEFLLATNDKESEPTLKEGEWRMGALHYDVHDNATAWGIFTKHPDGPEGDIFPIASDIPYWEGLEICRAHNLQMGIYNPEKMEDLK